MVHHKIAAGIIVYQDRPGLERLVTSLYEHLDIFIVVDGRYPDWGANHDPLYSTDDTREYCKSLDKVKYYQLFDDQNAKRTMYMQACRAHECDFLLVADADDFVHKRTDWDAFDKYVNGGRYRFEMGFMNNAEPQQIFNVQFVLSPERTQWIGRLFYKPYTLSYFSHWRVRRDNGVEVRYPRHSDSHVEGLVMTSDDMTRPTSRISIDIEYQWELFKREHPEDPSKFTPDKRIAFEKEIITEVIEWEDYYKRHGKKIHEPLSEEDKLKIE